MKRSSLFTLALAAVALAFAPVASASPVIPGSDYQYGYDPGTGLLPNNPALEQPSWTTHFTAGSSSIEEGLLVMDTPATKYHIYRMYGGNAGADAKSWNHSETLGSTIEFSARVRPGSSSSANRFQIITGVNTFNIDIGIGNFAGQSIDTTVFHTYRIDILPVSVENPNGTALVYSDNVLLTTLMGNGTGIAGNYIEFGNGFAALGGGVVEYGFIQWTNAGVLAPPAVPEPTTVFLSGIGLAFLALRLRHRN